MGYHSYMNSMRCLADLISNIFLRSLDKSETLQHSLDARGYNGELPVYVPPKKEE
jgi:cobalt/nickel transport system permease protein